MEDVDDNNASFPIALDNAIAKHRQFIVKLLERCRQNLDDDEILNIFGSMVRARDIHDGCKWFTGL